MAAPAPVARESALWRLIDQRAGLIGWAIVAASALLLVIGDWLQLVPGADGPTTAYGGGPAATLASSLLILTTSISGAVIVSARPRHRLGWLLVTVAPIGGLMALGYGLVRTAPPGSSEAQGVATLLDMWVQPYTLATASLLLLWFPTGRLPGRGWWPAYVLIAIGAVMRAIEGLLVPSAAGVYPTVRPDPDLGMLGGIAAWSVSVGGLGFRVLQTSLLIGAAALVLRYRRAGTTERRQITWVVVAGLVAFACSLPLAVVTTTQGTAVDTNEWAIVLFFLGFSLVGPAILIAITRYRLYEIDRIVNRAVLYGLLTAVIAGAATAAVALTQRIFVLVTGQTSDVAIVLSILVAASAYAPVRKRIEKLVDRRFKYERPRFGAYRDALVSTIELTTPEAAAGRLAREVRGELHAVGVAVTGPDGTILAVAGTWPSPIVARVPDGAEPCWRVLVGPREDDQGYAVAALSDVAEVVALVERAAVQPTDRRAAWA